MIYDVYFWKKPDESRLYISHCVPSPQQRENLRNQGYKIYLGHVELPDEPESPRADAELPVPAHEVIDVSVGTRLRSVVNGRTGEVVQVDARYIVVKWSEPMAHEGSFTPEAFQDRMRDGDFLLLGDGE